MALSGSISVAATSQDTLKFSWTSTQSIANNQSTVSWKLQLIAGSSGYIQSSAAKDWSVTVNGTKYSGTNTIGISNNSTKTLASGSTVITHNSDGTKTFSFSFSQEIAITWGSTYIGTKTGSGTGTLNAIPRQATITSAPNFSDEDNPVVEYSNPAGSAVEGLQICIADTTGNKLYALYRDVSKSGTKYTFELTSAERTALRNACASAKTMQVKFYIKTVLGGVNYTSSAERTLSIVNAAPIISSASAKDTNEFALAVTGDSQTLVRSYNNVAVSMSASAQKGATIKKYEIKNGYTSISGASGSFQNVDSGVFLFSVTDSRGYVTEKTVTLNLIKYIKLTCDLNAKAPDAEGNLAFTITGNCFKGSFGKAENTVHVYMRYKENSGEYSAWTPMEVSVGSSTYKADVSMSGLNYQSRYTFQAKAADGLMTVTSGEKVVKTIPAFHWGEDDFEFNVLVLFQNDIRALDKEGNEFSLLQKVLEIEETLKTLTQS